VCGAFFFAMRSCEYCQTPTSGKTKMITLSGVLFRTADKTKLDHNDPLLLDHAEFVTITFVDQKNGKKMDSRTQRRTLDSHLCPILRWGSAIKRILQSHPSSNGDTPLCSTQPEHKQLLITNTFVRHLLRHVCSLLGGEPTFGFHPSDIGNKSIRSGAAMALFLMDHSVAKIMILGRWSSNAFMVYIRPQVLEWTNNMSKDMIEHDTFFDASPKDKTSTADSRLQKQLLQTFNGHDSVVVIPRFHLHH
jgi:hypothetical protein